MAIAKNHFSGSTYTAESGRVITIKKSKLVRDSSESYVSFSVNVDGKQFDNLLEHSEYLARPGTSKKVSLLHLNSSAAALPPGLACDVLLALRWYLKYNTPEHDNSYLSCMDIICFKYPDIKFLLIESETHKQIDRCISYTGLVNLMYYRAAYDNSEAKDKSTKLPKYYVSCQSFFNVSDECKAVIDALSGTASEIYKQLTNSIYAGSL